MDSDSASICRRTRQEADVASTYMGKPYYPAWLDNLADDVTGEGGA
jgi:hypothetical protein